MRELSQQFTFDANASEVYEFIMGPEQERPRDIEMTDGDFAFVCRLLIGSGNRGLYNITLGVHVCDGDRIDYTRPNANWLVWDKEVAELALFQERPGECKVMLHIETDPQRWQWRDDGPWIVPMSVGTRFVIALWHRLIQDWINQRAAVGTETQVMQKEEIAFEVLFKETPAQFAHIANSLSTSLKQNRGYLHFPYVVMEPKMGLNDMLPDDTVRVDVDMVDPEDMSGLGFIRAQSLTGQKSSLVATRYKNADAVKFTKWWSELLDRLKRLNLVEYQMEANTSASIPATELMPHLKEIKDSIGDLKRGQAVIYRKIDEVYREPLKQIVELIQMGRLEQGEMTRTIEAIRLALRAMQTTDLKLTQEIQDAAAVVESDLEIQQKLELSLPLIPLLLQYKVEISAGSEADLNEALDRIKERWNFLRDRVKK